MKSNTLGQPIGADVPGWTPRAAPARTPMAGRFCRLEPLAVAHAAALHEANALDGEARNWTYLPYGPFKSVDDYRAWVEKVAREDDPLFFTILDSQGRPVGVASLMRIDRANGVIEIGHLNFSPLMQRTPVATEAIFLMLERSFDELGYRRCEWKCDSLNLPSRAAAERFGFTYEGLFRQAVVVKGRNRDTTWYSIIAPEWPAIRKAYESWLAPDNFDAQGRQRRKLGAFMPTNNPTREHS
jgi:RimJ/RimL family protein N-acetyltransferase